MQANTQKWHTLTIRMRQTWNGALISCYSSLLFFAKQNCPFCLSYLFSFLYFYFAIEKSIVERKRKRNRLCLFAIVVMQSVHSYLYCILDEIFCLFLDLFCFNFVIFYFLSLKLLPKTVFELSLCLFTSMWYVLCVLCIRRLPFINEIEIKKILSLLSFLPCATRFTRKKKLYTVLPFFWRKCFETWKNQNKRNEKLFHCNLNARKWFKSKIWKRKHENGKSKKCQKWDLIRKIFLFLSVSFKWKYCMWNGEMMVYDRLLAWCLLLYNDTFNLPKKNLFSTLFIEDWIRLFFKVHSKYFCIHWIVFWARFKMSFLSIVRIIQFLLNYAQCSSFEITEKWARSTELT